MIDCVVIGCGWAGMHHLRTVTESSCARLVAAVEPDRKKAEAVERETGVPVLEDLEALFGADLSFDAAIVATLPDLHKEQCLALLQRGAHILCEKPVCRSSADIRELMRAAQAAGTRFGVVFNQRLGTAVQMAKALLEQDLTPRHLVTASMYQHWPTKTGGHIREDFMITDACCHLLDLVTYLAGPVAGVKAMGKKVRSQLYSDVAALLDFEDGGVGIISHSNVGGKLDTQHPFQTVDVHTGLARYQIDNQCDRLTVYPHDGRAREVYETSVFERRDYLVTLQAACRGFLEALDRSGPLPATLQEALANTETLEKIQENMRKEAATK